MFLTPSILMFLSFMITGTMISVSSSSWAPCWLGLEVNLMSFIPLIMMKASHNTSEASIKYFLTQAVASLLLIFSSSYLSKYLGNNELVVANFMLMISLLTKLGVPPIHFWFPQVVKIIKWKQSTILMTWQKVAPFILLMNFPVKMMILPMILSSLVGAFAGMNQSKITLLMVYSSISHSSWMMASITSIFTMWMAYFLTYSILLLSVMLPFMFLKINHLKQISTTLTDKNLKNILMLAILSMAGMPPLLGFFIKIMVLQMVTYNMLMMTTMTILLILSTLTGFFYFRINYSLLFKMNYKSKIKNNNFKKTSMLNITSIMLNLSPILILII